MEQDACTARKAEAEFYTEQGRLLEAENLPAKAETRYVSALQLLDAVFRETGDLSAAAAAEDLCLSLADLNMQQGNMHGADVWYVRAMDYRQAQSMP